MSQQLTNKTALISGATRGLGKHIAIELAKHGAHIIALGRTVGALEELDDEIKNSGGTATLIPIDLLEEEKLDAIGPSLFPRFDALDFFIGNAAYLSTLSPVTHFKTEEWHKVIGTNLTANWLLLRSLDPLLRRAETGKAVFITDHQTSENPEAYWGPYAASKAALESLVKAYAEEIKETPIKAWLYNPGPMGTKLRRKAFPGEDQSTLPLPETIAKHLVETLINNQHPSGSTITYT